MKTIYISFQMHNYMKNIHPIKLGKIKSSCYCFQDKSEYETDGAYGSEYEYAEGIQHFFFTPHNFFYFFRRRIVLQCHSFLSIFAAPKQGVNKSSNIQPISFHISYPEL